MGQMAQELAVINLCYVSANMMSRYIVIGLRAAVV